MASFAHLSRVTDDVTRDAFRLVWGLLEDLEERVIRLRRQALDNQVSIDDALAIAEGTCIRQEAELNRI